MIALASDPAARYPDASSFAFAARRSVFPRGRSLLTGLPGLRRATRENVILSRPRRLSRADEPTHPLAPRLTRVGLARTRRRKRRDRATAVDGAHAVRDDGGDGAGGDAVWRGVFESRAPDETTDPRLRAHRDREADGYALTHRNSRTDYDTHPTATPKPIPPIPRLTLSGFTWISKIGKFHLHIYRLDDNHESRQMATKMGWNWVGPINPSSLELPSGVLINPPNEFWHPARSRLARSWPSQHALHLAAPAMQ